MPRKPPPYYGPAKWETTLDLYKAGRCQLSAAMRAHPGLSPEDALVAAQRNGGPLDPSTIYKYRADLKRILTVVFRFERRMNEFAPAWEALNAALTKRKAKIAPEDRRTSAKKVTDATAEEAYALFCELKRHALKYQNPNSSLGALYVLVAGHTGFRPVELVGARLEGTILALPNAKRRAGHSHYRTIDIGALHDDVIAGIRLLVGLIDPDMRKSEFKKWQKCVAQQMRRACERIGNRTLSLYSFRHVAIATWSRAGLSPAEIARLCGHISIRTAHQHYARANVGHKRKAVARAADIRAPETGPTQAADEAAMPATSSSADTRRDSRSFEVEDMPEPVYKQEEGRKALTSAQIAAAKVGWSDGRGSEEIAANLRAAERRRAQREGGRSGGELRPGKPDD